MSKQFHSALDFLKQYSQVIIATGGILAASVYTSKSFYSLYSDLRIERETREKDVRIERETREKEISVLKSRLDSEISVLKTLLDAEVARRGEGIERAKREAQLETVKLIFGEEFKLDPHLVKKLSDFSTRTSPVVNQ